MESDSVQKKPYQTLRCDLEVEGAPFYCLPLAVSLLEAFYGCQASKPQKSQLKINISVLGADAALAIDEIAFWMCELAPELSLARQALEDS